MLSIYKLLPKIFEKIFAITMLYNTTKQNVMLYSHNYLQLPLLTDIEWYRNYAVNYQVQANSKQVKVRAQVIAWNHMNILLLDRAPFADYQQTSNSIFTIRNIFRWVSMWSELVHTCWFLHGPACYFHLSYLERFPMVCLSWGFRDTIWNVYTAPHRGQFDPYRFQY